MTSESLNDRRKIFESLFPEMIGWEGQTFRCMSNGKYEFDEVNDAWLGFILAWNYQQEKLDAAIKEMTGGCPT